MNNPRSAGPLPEEAPAEAAKDEVVEAESKILAEALRPDLYIGLVGAAGTNLSTVRDELRAQMAVVGYEIEHIKVSDLLKEVLGAAPAKDESSRIKSLMAAGDAVRRCSENGDGVAALVIAEIRRRRDGLPSKGATAFIIDSLKNPKEVDLLDGIYGRNYYTLSVYLSRDERVKNLGTKIAKDRHEPLGAQHLSIASELVNDDERGSGNHAQNVQDTFPKADYFINSRRPQGAQIKRFVELVFGEPFTTPTIDEFHMFMARAAGYRSADLSRQVGAVIVDTCGAVAATGCNEVPYPGGGIFYEGRQGGPGDNRDFVNQFDPNYAEIQRSLIELIKVLRSAKLLENVESGDAEIVESLLQGQHKQLMSNARIKSLIEFGRIVHAEMHAICEAASAGKAIRGGVLYCTTFPCHVCARHIIAAGISEVVYIEPYPKSLTAQLYPDEVEFAHEDGAIRDQKPLAHVIFRPFHGTAPVFFQRAFRYRTRKNQYGTIATWLPTSAEPQGAALSVERPLLEASAANSIAAVLEKAKVAYEDAIKEV